MNAPDAPRDGALRTMLAEGAAFVTPGPVPADAVLTGARRRVARARTAAAVAGVLILAGAATGVALGTGSGRASGPAVDPSSGPRPSATTPAWTPPTWTVVKGLAAGQTVIHDRNAPYGDDPGTVLLSGTVDGTPWQLRGASVSNPATAPKGWRDMAGGPDSHALYCDYLHLQVGPDLLAGGGGCGLIPDVGAFTSSDMRVAHSDGPYRGGTASDGFVQVPEGTARVLLIMPDGRRLTATPVLTAFGPGPIAVFPLAPAGPWTVRCYDAAGNEVALYTDPPAMVQDIYGSTGGATGPAS